jgi:hypothetical protein
MRLVSAVWFIEIPRQPEMNASGVSKEREALETQKSAFDWGRSALAATERMFFALFRASQRATFLARTIITPQR